MKKRSNGEGSIRRQPNGTWRAEIMDGYRDDGKRRIVRFSGATKGEVQTKLREHQRLVSENVHIDKSMSFSKWGDIWYEDYKSQVKPSTYSGYKYTLKLLKEQFGNQEISAILPISINRFFDKLADKGYSISQRRKCRAMLIQIFTAADDNGLVPKNPALKAKKIGRKNDAEDGKTDKDAFTDDEVELLFGHLPENLIGCAIRLVLVTGMRIQELLALRRTDISEDGSTINIDKAVATADGVPYIGTPKSESSKRVIPVPEEYRRLAIFVRENGGMDSIFAGKGKGGVYSVGTFRRQYYAAIKDIDGVRKLPPHCCRHTYATQLEKKGVPLHIISKLMGHSGIEVTRVYLHTDIETLSEAASVLNRLVKNKECASADETAEAQDNIFSFIFIPLIFRLREKARSVNT